MAFSFEIKEVLGALSKPSPQGWTKELTLVSWNNREPKFDIRLWDEEHENMKKGVTLTLEEMYALKDLLNCLPLENYHVEEKEPTIVHGERHYF